MVRSIGGVICVSGLLAWIPLAAQAPDRQGSLDSLVATVPCARALPIIEDHAGGLTDAELCAIVSAALDHLAQQDDPERVLPRDPDAPGSHVTVWEVTLQRELLGPVFEAAWYADFWAPQDTRKLRVSIDQRTGHTVSDWVSRTPSSSTEAPPQVQGPDLITALFPPQDDRYEPWRAGWWREWETGSYDDERAMLANLDLCGDTDDYHVAELTGDSVPDLVYSGAAIGLFRIDGECPGVFEGAITTLFWNRDGSLETAFEKKGYIVWMARPSHWQPISEIVLRFDGCCGDLDSHVTFYDLVDRDALRFAEYDRITLRTSSPEPERLFDVPEAYRVSREPVNLQASPRLVDFAEEPEEFLARFGPGATGAPIGETLDAAGRAWWFVIMDPGSEPWNAPPSDGNRWAGWVRSPHGGRK